MRKGRDGGENEMKNEKKKIMAEIVATTSLPVNCLTATDCNAAARAKKEKKMKTILVATNVVASRPPERRPTATPTARANNAFC